MTWPVCAALKILVCLVIIFLVAVISVDCELVERKWDDAERRKQRTPPDERPAD